MCLHVLLGAASRILQLSNQQLVRLVQLALLAGAACQALRMRA